MKGQHRPGLVAWAAAVVLLVGGCAGPGEGDGLAQVTAESSVSQTRAPGEPSAAQTRAPAEPRDVVPAKARSTATEGGDDTGGDDTGGDDTGGEETATGQAATSTAAVAVGAEVAVHDAPGGAVTDTFGNPTAAGAPLTFMVITTADDWLEVQLPVRPNGSTAWVRASDVITYDVAYSLKVSTETNTLDVYRHGTVIHSFSVATGTGQTPTPVGTYYLTELIAPTNSGYGPYAYGISAYSDVLNEFGGGPGQIGLHGTDDEGSIGEDASHGCIRLSNEDITTLASLLPLGTPIEIG